MDQIRPWLYIGKYRETLDQRSLSSCDITAMLLLAELVEHEGIKSCYLAVDDGESLPVGEALLRATIPSRRRAFVPIHVRVKIKTENNMMNIQYDREIDTLHVFVGEAAGDPFELRTGGFTVFLDENNQLTELVIHEASRFVAQTLTAGVEVEDVSVAASEEDRPVWEDVDSSMISAFKYDASAEVLEVMFNRTGVYQYFEVPVDVVEGLREASSKGSYMRSYVIDAYPYKKLRR